MPVIDFNKIPHARIWDGIHGALHHTDNLTFAHVTVEAGTLLPQHQHMNEQWTHVIEGELEFTMGDETVILSPGVSAHIPPHVPHSARALTKVKLIDCFLPTREEWKTLEPWQS